MQVLETMQPSEIKLSNGTSLDQIVFIGKCIYTEHICIMCIYVCNDVRIYIYIQWIFHFHIDFWREDMENIFDKYGYSMGCSWNMNVGSSKI